MKGKGCERDKAGQRQVVTAVQAGTALWSVRGRRCGVGRMVKMTGRLHGRC